MDPMHPPSEESFAYQLQAYDQPDETHEDDFDLILLGSREERAGSTPGNVRIRVTLSPHQPFHRIKEGELEATEAAGVPEGSLGRLMYWLKRVLIGVPLASVQAEGERLTKFQALAVLSSDAISSVAYATEAILISLVAAGSGHLGFSLLISLAIVALLTIVAWSYRQTIPAYPNGVAPTSWRKTTWARCRGW